MRSLDLRRRAYSAIITTRHGDWRSARISAAFGSRIERHPGAKLNLGGWMAIGHFPSPVGDLDIVASRRRAVVRLLDSATADLGANVRLGPGVRCVVAPRAHLKIGSGSFVTADSLIVCRSSVTIGHDCAISWQVQIMDWDMHRLDPTRPDAAPIVIGDRVWIGSRVTILKGVSIGEGAVIGAGAVVTRDVPPGCVFAGNPGRVVRERVEWCL